MSLPIFRYPRGAALAYDHVISGTLTLDPATVTVLQHLKPASGQAVPPRTVASVATFSTSYVAAMGDNPAYWRAELAPAQSAALDAGWYASDAEFLVGGAVVTVSDPVLILIAESVTPA